VNSLNVGTSLTATNAASEHVRGTSHRHAKSLNSNATASFDAELNELETLPTTGGGGAQDRQNFVAALSNSRASAPQNSGSDPSTAGSTPASGGNAPASAATGLIQTILASQAVSASPVSTSSPTNQSASAVTLAGPATPYKLTQVGSNDPTIYTKMSYSEELNYSIQEQAANDENARRYQNYLTSVQNWHMNGSQGKPPDAPTYETVDRAGFEKWWAQYQQNFSSGGSYTAPDLSMFLANAPGVKTNSVQS